MTTSTSKAKNRWNSLYFVARLAIGCALLVLVFRFVDLQQMVDRFRELDSRYALAVCLVVLAGRVLRAFKWNMLLRVGGVNLTIWQAIRLCFVGNFFAAWVPGSIGGDAYRVIALRNTGHMSTVLSSIVVERYAKIFAHAILAMAVLPWTIPYLVRISPWLLLTVLACVLAVTVVIPLMLSRPFLEVIMRAVPALAGGSVASKLRQFNEGLAQYLRHPLTLFVFTVLTLFEVLSFFLINYLAARAIGLDAHLAHFLVAMPAAHLVLQIPISIQAIGIQEAALTTAMVAIGYTVADGATISLIQRGAEWICSILPGAVLFALTRGTSASDSRVKPLHGTAESL